MIINKELLSLVLDIEATDDISKCGNIIEYGYMEDGEFYEDEINLDTLGRECKEWALEKEFTILSYPSSSVLIFNTEIKDTCYNTNFENPKKYDPMCDIIACQWILENA